jgi:hypothetical protein
MNAFTREPGTTRAVAAALAAAAWCAFLWGALRTFGPESAYVQPFNSDSALPVLMANDTVVDPFRTYIYGQDQIGAWHLIPLQLARRATGRVWTPRSVYVVQTVWLFLGVLALAALSRRAAYLGGALFLVALCLHPLARHYLFVLNQRYAWQVTPLALGWWVFRRLCSRQAGARRAGGACAASWLAASFVCSLLAVWNSATAAPMLLAFVALEALRARVLGRAESPSEAQGTRRPSVARLLAPALPIVVAVFAEQLLKANYHRFALRHFGQDFRTPTEVDWGHLAVNLRAQAAQFVSAPWWWLTIFALAAAPVAGYSLLRRRAPGNDGDSCRAVARLDLSVLMLGALAVALVNFAASFAFVWMRLNAYGPRYLALTHLFGSFAGLVALALVATLPAGDYGARRFVFPAATCAALVVLALKFPPRRKDASYDTMKGAAAGLAARAPGAVLLGGYWDAYALAALETPGAITPVPAEDQLLRTPWSPAELRDATRVVVVHHVFPHAGEPETPAPYTAFGDGRSPPAVIRQHGATLRLEAARWLEHGGYVFSLYRNEGAGDAH